MVNSISARTQQWQSLPFGMYDCIIDLAAVTPYSSFTDPKKEGTGQPSEEAYFSVNRDLTFSLGKKAKEEGCRHFLFMSSMDVYGLMPRAGKRTEISKNTDCRPQSFYGQSKLAGEESLRAIEEDDFHVTVLRVPMVYGPECRGAYEIFRSLAASGSKLPSFRNELSAIHISTLCAFIQYLLDQEITGTFHPQNREYLSGLELLELAAKETGSQLRTSRLTGLKYRLFPKSVPPEIHQVFGSVVYGKEIDL